MPSDSLVRLWVIENREGFAPQYARAKDMGLDALAEEIIEISNTPVEGTRTKDNVLTGVTVETGDMIEHRRLQVDARKWYLSKLAPKRYGDKLEVEHKGELSIVERLTAARKRTGS